MIKIDLVELSGFKGAFYGMRNPKNSWDRADSTFDGEIKIGPNDEKLSLMLTEAGTDHRKLLRMIHVQVNVTAPMFWWSEADTYKVATVANSTSKMHKLLAKPFEKSDFSFDNLYNDSELGNLDEKVVTPLIGLLNDLRDLHRKEPDKKIKKKIWYSILEILPESYNQLRTWDLNYETLIRIHERRKNHKQYEWREFCKWIETLPYMKELLAVTEPESVDADKEYSHRDIILQPAVANKFIGKEVYCGNNANECVARANSHEGAVVLKNVLPEEAYPFVTDEEADNTYMFIIPRA